MQEPVVNEMDHTQTSTSNKFITKVVKFKCI